MNKKIPELPEYISNPDPGIYEKDYIVVDFETTNLDKGDPVNGENSLVSVAWYDSRDGRVYYHRGNEYQMDNLVSACEEVAFIVAHNAKFECGWLKRCGVDLTKIFFFCTQVAEYTIKSNRQGWPLDLDSCLDRYKLGSKDNLVKIFIHMGVCPSIIPGHWLERYNKQDVLQEHELYKKQIIKLKEKGLLNVFYTRCLQVPFLADIEFNGVCLDKERVEVLYAKYNKELQKIRQELAKITGGINTRSSKQLSEFLFGTLGFTEPKDYKGNPIRTDRGKPSTSKEAIGRLKASTKNQREFIKLKKREGELASITEKYLEKFYTCVNEDDGIFYAKFNQTTTATGRYSSTGGKYKTQFQNLARILKPLFKARNSGWKIGDADEGSLEFRVAVYLGKDEQGVEDLANPDFDAHNFTADIIFGKKEYIKNKHPDRQDAKAHTFKPLYGGTSGTKQQKKYYQAFKDKYNGISNTQEQWIDEGLSTNKLVVETGNIFYFPKIKVLDSGYVVENEKIRDYPVQYLATAEIVPVAAVATWYWFKLLKLNSFIGNTVHDSIIAELHPEEIELFKEICVKAMEEVPITYLKDLYDIDFNIPLEAEVSINDYWNDSENWKQQYLYNTSI